MAMQGKEGDGRVPLLGKGAARGPEPAWRAGPQEPRRRWVWMLGMGGSRGAACSWPLFGEAEVRARGQSEHGEGLGSLPGRFLGSGECMPVPPCDPKCPACDAS